MTTNKPRVIAYCDPHREKGYVVLRRDVDPNTLNEGDPLIHLSDYEDLWEECEKLRTKTSATLGVGDGSGMLFVHGDYDSIKRVQALMFEFEHLRKDAERYRYIRKGNQWVVAATQTGFHIDGGDLDDLVDAGME